MVKFIGEISQQFTPSLFKKNKPIKQNVIPVSPNPNNGSGLFDRLKNPFGKQEILQAQAIEQIKVEAPSGTVEERSGALFQLLLDRVELQVDIHRRASAIVDKIEFSPQEIQQEVARMKTATREVAGTDGQPQQELIWKNDTSQQDLENAAKSHLRSQKLNELRSFDRDPLDLTSHSKNGQTTQSAKPQEISDADILSGKLSMAELMSCLTTVSSVDVVSNQPLQEDPILTESKRQLVNVNQQINRLMEDPKVVEHYQEMKQKRVDLLRQAKEASYGKKALHDIEVMQERLARQVFLDKRTFSPAEERVIKQNQLIARAIEQRLADLTSNSEVFDLMRWRSLREYQAGLKRDRFAETPSRERMITSIRRMWSEGRRILATGPTGSGKTELFLHASRALFGNEPERATGHELLTAYEIYGKFSGKGFESGPLTRAVDRNRPFVFDEINLVPNKILMRLKTDLNARPGQDITVQEENGVLHHVKDGFVVGATANVKSEKHPDREKLDPALVRMFEPLQVDYLPQEELHDMMLASLMDIKGGIQLSSKDDLNALAELCQATAWIQQAYRGYEVDLGNGDKLYARGGESTGKMATLREAVLDPGKALDMVNGWEDSRLRGKTLREHMNDKIVQFVKNENFPEEDRYHLVRIFALNEFLRGVKIEDLGLSGLDQSTLDAWNGFNGRKIKPGDVYLTSEQVAKIDPFGVVQRPDGSAVDDLLGGDETEEFADEVNEPEALRFAPKKQENRPANAISSMSSSRELRDLDAKYPESAYITMNDDARLGVVPETIVLAASINPGVLSEGIYKWKKMLDSVPTEEKKSTNASNIPMRRSLEAVNTMIDIAKTNHDNTSLAYLNAILTSFEDYASFAFTTANFSFRHGNGVYYDYAVNTLRSKMKT